MLGDEERMKIRDRYLGVEMVKLETVKITSFVFGGETIVQSCQIPPYMPPSDCQKSDQKTLLSTTDHKATKTPAE